MSRAFTILTALLLFLGWPQASTAEKARIKWITSVYSGPEGVGLKHPEGVACGDDYLVVADTGNNRLVYYTYRDEIVTAEQVLPVANASPIMVQVTSQGDLYFLDGKERRIVALAASGETRVLTPKSLPGSGTIVPRSFRIDENDSIYILDIFSERVLVVDREGQYLRHVSFPVPYGFFSDLAVGRNGGIFLLDSVDAVVYFAAKNADQFSPVTESMRDYMNFPKSLSLDDRGTIYLVDQYGSGLALVAPDGSFLGRKLGLGWNDSGLYYPSQVCISKNGDLFVADRNNSRIQLFSTGATEP